MTFRRILLPLALGALLLSGCGAGDDLETVSVQGAKDTPTLSVEAPFEVRETSNRLITTGDGPALTKGQKVLVNYQGVNGRTGEVFDTSFGKEPVEFHLEDGALVPGFIQGLVGAPVGSRVLIAMPSEDGYPEGQPDAGIEKGDSLLFLVDVLSAREVLTHAEGDPVDPVPGNPEVEVDDEGVPTVTVPPGPPPVQPVIQPLIEGKGPELTAGQTVVVQFHVVRWSDGSVVESSWEQGQPGRVQVGVGQWLPALDAALLEENIGSRVLVVTHVPESAQAPTSGATDGPSATASPSTAPGQTPSPAATRDRAEDTYIFVIDVLDA